MDMPPVDGITGRRTPLEHASHGCFSRNSGLPQPCIFGLVPRHLRRQATLAAMPPPLLVAHAVRSGIAALNCVTGAVDDDVEVRFVRDQVELVRVVREGRAAGRPVVVAWSFYSVDFDAAAADSAALRPHTPGAMHVAGGVHATAEPLATLRAGFDLLVLGEGETTLRTLLRAVARGERSAPTARRRTPGRGRRPRVTRPGRAETARRLPVVPVRPVATD